MRPIPLALVGALLATAAIAQDAPPPPRPAAHPGPMATSEPPPPPSGPRGDHPPPPGAAVMLERGPNGTAHVDVHCARTDSTKECADVATRLLAEMGAK